MASSNEHNEQERPEYRVRRQSFQRRLMATFAEMDETTRQFKLLCRASLCLYECGEDGLSHEVLNVADKRAIAIGDLCGQAMKRAQKGNEC